MSLVEVKVPDIGDFSDVPVIDLFVKVGDSIKVDDAIATLESDKATMDVPSTVAGTASVPRPSSTPSSLARSARSCSRCERASSRLP